MAGNDHSKSPTSHLHVMNLIVALGAGIISITGGVYSLKNYLFSVQNYGSFQGTVRDSRLAKPLWLAGVEVSTADGAVVNTATSDQKGRYVVEKLKTGNYGVKFSAPLHTSQTKKVLIEKNLPSSINVDLVPAEEPQKAVPASFVNENMGSRYPVAQQASPSRGGAAVQGTSPAGSGPSQQNYGMQNPATSPFPSDYAVSQNPGGVSPYDSSQPLPTGHRRRRYVPGSHYPVQTGTGGYDNSGNAGQAPDSLNNAASQAGLQLMRELFAKKTDKQSTS